MAFIKQGNKTKADSFSDIGKHEQILLTVISMHKFHMQSRQNNGLFSYVGSSQQVKEAIKLYGVDFKKCIDLSKNNNKMITYSLCLLIK